MKHKFIIMEIEAGLCVLLRQGPYYNSYRILPKSRQERTCTAHLTPMHIYSYTLHVFTMYRTVISWPVNKGIYKYIQICIYRINEREGNRNYPKWGFDLGCLD